MNKKFYQFALVILSLGFGFQAMAQNGGDNCATATTIASIPYTANGFTTGMANNYNTVCADAANSGGGRDVVYKYTTSTSAEYVNIGLCSATTNFDAQLYVYEATCTGTPVACREDGCSNPPTFSGAFIPVTISNVALNPSTTYYIVVDGYNTASNGNFTLTITLGVAPPQAAVQFTDRTSLLPTTSFHSGNAVGVADMNGDGKDDIIRAQNNSTMYIDYQTTSGGNFTETSYANAIGDPWGMCVGDVNNDGMNDVLWGDNGAARILVRNGATYTSTNVTTATGQSYLFTQGANFHDIDNDGYIDAYVCHDVGMSHIYKNSAGTGWTFNQSLIPMATVPTSDNSGNYAALFTDINNDNMMDLYVTHCRQAISNPADARRINQIFLNDGDYTYTQDVTNFTNLRIGAQSWSSDFGDMDNDGDMDAFVLNYDVESQFLENNGSGVFTNIIASSGISGTATFFGMNVIFEDFNNDTYLDVLITGDDEHRLYINNGNMTFTQDLNDFTYATYNIQAQGTGDLNHDGHIDVYASYCDLYNNASTRNDKLWMNDGVDGNNFITFQTVGTSSNINGIGAIIKIYGPWGVQIREVRSGEGYGVMNSLDSHFGLGQNTIVDSVHVFWPSGIEDIYEDVTANQFLTITEGETAVAPTVTVSSNDADNSICAGTSVVFTAAITDGGPNPSYQWKLNNGNVGTNSNTYSNSTLANGDVVTCVLTSDQGNASINNPATAVNVTMTVISVPPTPTISQNGNVLSSSSASGNQWYLDGNILTGENNQDITVTTEGVYTVTVSSTCASPTSSGFTAVAPTVSVSGDDADNTICEGTTVVFTANITNGGSNPSYQWKLNGGNVGTDSDTYSNSTLVNGDIVTCELTSDLSNAIVNNPATAVNITMTVNSIPATPSITQNGNVLSSSSASGNQWYLDGNILSGETNQDITVTTNGVYTVVVTTSGCSSASSSGLTTTVGIATEENPYSLVIFPNPNDGKFNINFTADKSDSYTLELYNAIGQVVISKQISNHAGTYQLPVVLEDISSGMYTIVLTNGKKEVFKKVIVY